MLLEISAAVKSYDGHTKWMNFLIEDDGLLEKYDTIWDKVSTDIKGKLIASQSTPNNFSSHGGQVTDFYD